MYHQIYKISKVLDQTSQEIEQITIVSTARCQDIISKDVTRSMGFRNDKDMRQAVNAHYEDDQSASQKQISFTSAQYQQILQLIGKDKSDEHIIIIKIRIVGPNLHMLQVNFALFLQVVHIGLWRVEPQTTSVLTYLYFYKFIRHKEQIISSLFQIGDK